MIISNNQKNIIFLIFFLVLTLFMLYMFKSFFNALIVGALIAYFLYPIYTKIKLKVKNKVLSQIILSVSSVLIIILFLGVIVSPLISQTQTVYQKVEYYIDNYDNSACADTNTSFCQISEKVKIFIGSEEFAVKAKELIGSISVFFYRNMSSVVNNIILFVFSIVIIVFSIFYFLDYGVFINRTILSILPMRGSHKMQIFARLRQTINAVVGGNISTALLQGIAGGMIFAILGIPSALFWGLLMFILAFIPAVGPALIWIPATILLFSMGNITQGIILLVYCILVLGYIDNILKPKLIGDKIKLSSFAIFLGVIGGLQTFGFLGLFFGPIIIALFVTCIDIYKEMNKKEA
ncbi:MAG: AI-2E family transporter [Nanoarchaeota archaeon]|nr:AI-2E family transporter [Nanoarchaeota archaeon]